MTENFYAADRQFVTDNSDVQSVLEAAVENNRFNDGQWASWETAEHMDEVYESGLGEEDLHELGVALNLLKAVEAAYGTDAANGFVGFWYYNNETGDRILIEALRPDNDG